MVRRVADGRAVGGVVGAVGDDGGRRPFLRGGVGHAGREPGEVVLAGEVEAARVGALGGVEVAGQRDAGVGGTAVALGQGHLVLDQLVDRDRGVDQAVDEGGVRTVLEQAADEVGQQRLVGADRRVDAAGAVQRVLADDLVVEGLAHAVQALELPVQAAAQLVDGRQRVGVVGGELGVDRVGGGEQLLGTGEVGDVGVHLAGVDRVAGLAVHLRLLDLAVPVGALDQADHEAAVAAPGEVDQPVEHVGAALLVGLDDHADAVPAGEIGVVGHGLDQVERELEPVGLLGVDVAADVVVLREQEQGLQPRQELGHDARVLGTGIARVQGRELDRDAGAGVDAPARGRPADGVDRVLVGREVAGGVVRRWSRPRPACRRRSGSRAPRGRWHS